MEFVGTELIFIHILLSLPLLLPPIWNLYWLLKLKSHTQIMRHLAITAPAYYTLLSACVFSGFVIWAMLGFVLTFKILAMLFIWILVFGLEIRRHSWQKKIRVEADSKKREKFFWFARFKYLFDICAFALLSLSLF